MYKILFVLTGEFLYKKRKENPLWLLEEIKESIASKPDEFVEAVFKTQEKAEAMFILEFWEKIHGNARHAYIRYNGEKLMLCDSKIRSLFEIVKVPDV